MSDYTKADSQLMDWTTLDDTGAIPFLETSELDMSDGDMQTVLHIDMAHQDTNDAGTNYAGAIVLVQGGSTDEDWHELCRMQATGGQATSETLAANSGASQANPDRIEVADETGFTTYGDAYFLKDAGTLANSCLFVLKDYVTTDYLQAMDNLVNDYDTSDIVYDLVDQWSIQLPDAVSTVKVAFYNADGDATYACRVQVSQVTDLE